MNHFRIGGKVVCVFGGPWYCTYCGGLNCAEVAMPVCDQVYTVSDIISGRTLTLRLAEIDAPVHGLDGKFAAECFRPVIERSTDIGAFTELLNPLNHKPIEPTPGDRVRPRPVPVSSR